MLKEFKERIDRVSREVIGEIRNKDLPKEAHIRCDDPYDPEQPAVEIYQITQDGVMTEEYEEVIAFDQWSVETLICILEQIETE